MVGCLLPCEIQSEFGGLIFDSNFLSFFWNADRPVALMARASDSKSGGWGFESLLACIKFLNGFKRLLNDE